MFFLNLCHLFLDNEEDETTNVMENASDFASSFASEQLQGEETSQTHTVKNNTQSTIRLPSPVVLQSSSLVLLSSPLVPQSSTPTQLLHQTKVVTLQLLLQHINMSEQEEGQ